MKKWSKLQIDYLTKNYSNAVYIGDLVCDLKRSRKSIYHKVKRLGLLRKRVYYKEPQNPQNKKMSDKKYYEKNKRIIYQRKKERIWDFKRELVIKLGGKCKRCGYNKCVAALDFHHVQNKENSISKMFHNASKKDILKEADKCILLCSNCHREMHFVKN